MDKTYFLDLCKQTRPRCAVSSILSQIQLALHPTAQNKGKTSNKHISSSGRSRCEADYVKQYSDYVKQYIKNRKNVDRTDIVLYGGRLSHSHGRSFQVKETPSATSFAETIGKSIENDFKSFFSQSFSTVLLA